MQIATLSSCPVPVGAGHHSLKPSHLLSQIPAGRKHLLLRVTVLQPNNDWHHGKTWGGPTSSPACMRLDTRLRPGKATFPKLSIRTWIICLACAKSRRPLLTGYLGTRLRLG